MSQTLIKSATEALEDPYDDFLDIMEAAFVKNPDGKRRYGSVATVRRAVESGALPSVLLKGKRVIDPADLEAWLTSRTVGPTFEDVRAWAHRIVALAGPFEVDRAEELVAIFRGGAPA